MYNTCRCNLKRFFGLSVAYATTTAWYPSNSNLDNLGDDNNVHNLGNGDGDKHIDNCTINKNINHAATEYLIREQQMQGFAGCTVAVMKNNELVFNKGIGYSDFENKITMHKDTIMRLASVSKALTGTAITKLLQINQNSDYQYFIWDINTPIQDILDNYPCLCVSKHNFDRKCMNCIRMRSVCTWRLDYRDANKLIQTIVINIPLLCLFV